MPKVIIYMDPTPDEIDGIAVEMIHGRVVSVRGKVLIHASDAPAPTIAHGITIPEAELPEIVREAIDVLRRMLCDRACKDLNLETPGEPVREDRVLE